MTDVTPQASRGDERTREELDRFPAAFTDPVRSRGSLAITGIFVLLVFYTIYFAAPVLIPITVAFLLSMLFSPFVDRLERIRIPRVLGSAVIMLAFVGFLATAVISLAGPAQEWVAKLPANFKSIEEKLKIIKRPLQDFQKATEQLESATRFSERPVRQKVEIQRPGMLEDIFSGTQRVIASVGVILILTFSLLASGDLILRKLVTVIPTLEDKRRAVEIMRSIQRDISYYLSAVTVINLGLGISVGLVAWALGIPNAALWGAVTAVLAFAPYVGSVAITAILTLVSMIEYDTFSQALVLPAIFLLLSAMVQSIVVPFVLGRRLLLSPVAIFIAIILWGWMWGIVGALIAVPVLASVKIICERFQALRPVAEFLTP
jgi:predicted PurR-regulated permease PerM